MMARTETKRRRRWSLYLAVVLILLVGGALAARALIDVERFRGPLERKLGESTGWQVELGEIDLSIVPLAVSVRPVVLDDPAGDSEIRVERLDVDASLRALFGGALEIRRLALQSPTISAVRDADQPDWRLPIPLPGGASTPSGSAGPKVSIARIDVSDGTIRLTDRTREPEASLSIGDLSASILTAGSSELSGTIGEGRVGATLDPATSTIAVELERIATESLDLWLGSELVRPGGTLDGSLTVAPGADGLTIGGELVAGSLLLLAGERRLDRADLDFDVTWATDRSMRLESLEVVTGETRTSGAGSLAPDLDVTLEIADSPIESVVETVRAIVPFPLELRPPGRGSARARVAAPAGEELRYSARGSITAAGYRAAEYLPEATDLAADFVLSEQGALTVELTDGTVGGGPLRGTARLDDVDPPGRLTFDGSLQSSPLGVLLAGFIGERADAISGPTGLETQLALDLSRGTIDLAALGGELTLDSAQVALPGWDLEAAVAERLEQKLGKYEELLGAVDAALGGKITKEREKLTERSESARSDVEQLLERLEIEIDFDARPWPLERVAFRGDSFEASGAGAFDAEQGRVALRLTAVFSEERTARWVAGYQALRPLVKQGRLTLPVVVDGPLTAPAIGVDLEGLAEEAVEDAKEEAVKDLLRGLLKKDR